MPTDYKIPLGQVIAEFIDWLTLRGADYFDAFADGLEFLIYSVTDALTWFNPLVLIALFGLLTLLIQRKLRLTIFVLLSCLLILNLGYWQETMETLAQVLFATVTCVVIGVPLGIYAAHKPRFYTVMQPGVWDCGSSNSRRTFMRRKASARIPPSSVSGAFGSNLSISHSPLGFD